MTKADLVAHVKEAAEMGSAAAAERAVNAVLDGITRGLKKNGIVSLTGFGKFEVRKTSSRKGRNPRTGETINIKAGKKVAFRPGQPLKDAV